MQIFLGEGGFFRNGIFFFSFSIHYFPAIFQLFWLKPNSDPFFSVSFQSLFSLGVSELNAAILAAYSYCDWTPWVAWAIFRQWSRFFSHSHQCNSLASVELLLIHSVVKGELCLLFHMFFHLHDIFAYMYNWFSGNISCCWQVDLWTS